MNLLVSSTVTENSRVVCSADVSVVVDVATTDYACTLIDAAV